MLSKIVRNLPRGVRPPGPVVTDDLDGSGQWWGPTYNTLPYASDGLATPSVIDSWSAHEAAAMSIPSAWRAMNLISGTIAQMPLGITEPGETDPSVEHGDNIEFGSVARRPMAEKSQLITNPWPLVTYYDWMSMVVTSVVLRGNFYGVKFDYDPVTGWPRQILPVHVDDVQVELRDGYPWYHILFMDRWLPFSEMFHVRGFMMPGMIQGVGVIEAHRNGLTQQRGLIDYGASAFASGIPPVVLTVDKPEISEQEATYLQGRWMERHGNVRDRRPAVVPKIVDVNVVGLSQDDAEYLDSRKFSIAEIAYMFNLDPSDLDASFTQASGTMKYENAETRKLDRLIFSMQMWISRIEQTFTFNVPGQQTVKFNTDELLRADTNTRMKTYEVALRNRIWTINEVRAMEGYPPIEGGDSLAINNTFGGAADKDADPTTDDRGQGGMEAPGAAAAVGAAPSTPDDES